MDPFDFNNTLQSEKATAIFRYNHFKIIAKLFRIVEILLGLVFISWTFLRLPFAVKISGEYFRQFISIIISPLFIFLICNVIVLTLLFKAGDIFSGATTAINRFETEAELFEGFIKTSDDISSPVPESSEIEYQDKQTILEVSIGNSPDVSEVTDTVIEEYSSDLKTYQRSRSDQLGVKENNSLGKLRRSETEKCRKVGNPGEVPEETVYIFDELSNEEFQKTIEDFIAKQIKFHREEMCNIVLHSHMSLNCK